MGDEATPLMMSQAEFSRRRGVSKKTVTQWKHKGLLVLSEDGRVNVEETEWALDQQPASYRGGVTHRPVRKTGNDREPSEAKVSQPTTQAVVQQPRVANDEATAADPDAPDYLGSYDLPMAEAVRRKENFLGLRRRHELEVARLEWVRVEDVGLEVEQDYATVRERVLTIAGKIASSLVGLTQAEIETTLRAELTEALHELHDPAGVIGRVIAGGAHSSSASGSQAAAGPQPN